MNSKKVYEEETETNNIVSDIIAEEKKAIAYRPSWAHVLGSVNAAILLQQINYWWSIKKEPFYKFKDRCSHALYVDGDSWCEELGFTPKEFDTAIAKISVTTKQKKILKQKGKVKILEWQNLVERTILMDRKTVYKLNTKEFSKLIGRIYVNANQHLRKAQKSIYVNDKSAFIKETENSSTETTYKEEEGAAKNAAPLSSSSPTEIKQPKNKSNINNSPKEQDMNLLLQDTELEDDTRKKKIASTEKANNTRAKKAALLTAFKRKLKQQGVGNSAFTKSWIASNSATASELVKDDNYNLDVLMHVYDFYTALSPLAKSKIFNGSPVNTLGRLRAIRDNEYVAMQILKQVASVVDMDEATIMARLAEIDAINADNRITEIAIREDVKNGTALVQYSPLEDWGS